jgi:hypothetical protein
MKSNNLTFAQIGEVFDDATTRMVGGVDAHNRTAILRDLSQVQSGIESLLQNHPDDFQGVAGIHAQNIVDQLNLEVTAIKSIGADPFAAKYINDVQRDLLDIVQGDTQLQVMATQGNHHGFEPVPGLLAPPAQFHGNEEQTAFMKGFVTTSQDFADRAIALADQHAGPAAVQQLIGEVQAYATEANAFTLAQGGLYSARFNNEFASDGVNGTASRALIDGLQTGNGDKVHAAAEVLVANSADVAGNMLGIGDPVPVVGNGIPDHVDTFAQAGTIFNDATAKLVGGIYDGNRQSIHNDLAATQQGLKDLLVEHADQFQGRAGADANRIIGLIGRELQIVDDVDAGPNAAGRINAIHSKIIDIVHKDGALATAAALDDANGFMQLPGLLKGHGNGRKGDGHDDNDDHHGNAHAAAPPAMPAAVAAMTALDANHQPDPLAHIFTAQVDPHLV